MANHTIGLVRCWQRGQPATGGATDWLGWFQFEDCAPAWDAVERKRQHVQDAEAMRVALVRREEAEREAMWAMAAANDG